MDSQDTFLELQEQLRATAQKGGPETAKRAETEKKLEDVVAELATKAGFEVKAVLGIGGMGAVVRAVDTQLKREVALKFLPPEMVKNPAKVAELRGEAEIVSRIKHENVVSILSWHEQENVPFYAMELVDGESLMDLVRRQNRLPVPEALRIMIEAARGVEALHSFNVIHRDIKPQNILISREGRVKITDFGISRTQDAIGQEARENKIAGTPQFMAPEQARGEAATVQSDIYSLAATLYYCLTGRPPVRTVQDVREQLRIVGEGRPIPIGNHLPKLHREVAKVVMKALNANPARRSWDLASYRQEMEAAYIAQMKDQDKGLVGTVLRRNGVVIYPVVTLLMGLALGYSMGRRGAAPAPAPPPDPTPVAAPAIPPDMHRIAPEVLGAMGAESAEVLRLITTIDPRAEAARAALDAYNNAVAANQAEEIARTVPRMAREKDLWISRNIVRLIAIDQRSPFRADALGLLAPGAFDDEQVFTNWRRTWLRYLDDLQRRPEMQPPPPAGATPPNRQPPVPGAGAPAAGSPPTRP